MTKPNSSGSLIGRKLLAGPVLALSLSASVSYAATEPAAAPKVVEEHRIVIVEKQGGSAVEDANLQARVVTKDGKTIVIKTDKALTDAEVEARVAKALAALPDRPNAPARPESGERRIIMKRIQPEGAAPAEPGSPDREKIAAACAASGQTSSFESSETGADGKQQKLVMRFCSAGASGATALAGLKSARDRISKDANLSPAIRDSILKQMDAEIDRLAKQG